MYGLALLQPWFMTHSCLRSLGMEGQAAMISIKQHPTKDVKPITILQSEDDHLYGSTFAV